MGAQEHAARRAALHARRHRLSFIALGFLFRTFARPEIGFTTLGIIMLTYFGRVRFKGGIPGGLVAVCLGTAIYWILVKNQALPNT